MITIAKMIATNDGLGWLPQVAIGAASVWFLWTLAAWAERMDRRAVTATVLTRNADMSLAATRKLATVFSGYADGVSLGDKRLDTITSSRGNYVDLGGDGRGSPSGGSNFSYSFWLLVRDPSQLPAAPMRKCVLFVKGDSKAYETFKTSSGHASVNSPPLVTKDVLVKSPMVSLLRENDGKLSVAIDLNTTKQLHASVVAKRHETMALTVGQWTLWTVTVEDSRVDNGCLVKFYVSDSLLHSEVLDDQSALQNQGDVHLFPTIPQFTGDKIEADSWRAGVFMADLQYANFPFEVADIREKMRAGVTRMYASLPSSQSVPDSVLTLTTLHKVSAS